MASRALRRPLAQGKRWLSQQGPEGPQRSGHCVDVTSNPISSISIRASSRISARWASTATVTLTPSSAGRGSVCALMSTTQTTTLARGLIRPFSTTQFFRREVKGQNEDTKAVAEAPGKELAQEQQGPSHLDRHGFTKSAKAEKASQINLRAKLSKEGAKTGNTWGDVWRLIKIARPEIKWFGLAILLLLTSSAVTMSIPKSVGKIIDQHADPDGLVSLSLPLTKSLAKRFGMDVKAEDESTFAMYTFSITRNQFLFGFGTILTFGAIANFGRILTLRFIGERVVGRLRSRLYKRTYTQDAEFFDANRTGDLLSRLSTDALIVGKSVTQNMSDGLRSAVTGGVAFGCMAYTSLELTSILLWAGPPVVLSAFFYGRKMRNLSRLLQKNLGSMTKVAEERLGNVKTAQAFAGESQEIHRFNKEVKTIAGIGMKEGTFSAIFFSSSGWMGNMTILALLGTGVKLVGSGAISVGDLTTFMLYTVFAGSSLFGISGFYSELMKGAGAASRLFELQDRDPLIKTTAGKPVTSALGPIRFQNVTFAYPVRPEVTVFNGLDFEIPSGSNVCVVGPSGGGKSTVASLLLRFYDVTGGSVQINGTDVRDMNLKSLRRRIGLVGQEPVLFSGTIAENIAYGRPNASREDIINAAQRANCQFISDFPDGLETRVGPRGAQLSGGQKQRVAIARALLKNPDILILDEATSALDAESETLVNAALAAVLKGHATTISIAHRLSTIKRSDSIIVLNNQGQVAEIGSYATLSANKDSAFSQLMQWQTTGVEHAVAPRHEPPAELTEHEEIEAELEEDEAPEVVEEAKREK